MIYNKMYFLRDMPQSQQNTTSMELLHEN